MFVDANAVEADVGRVDEFVDIFVVGAMPDLGIEDARVDVDPDGIVLLLEIRSELRIGHQMKPENLNLFVSLGAATGRAGRSWV